MMSLTKYSIRRIIFAIAAVSSLSTKLLHIYAHSDASKASYLVCWGPSFFTQDTLLLLALRKLLDFGFYCLSIAAAISVLILSISSTNLTFFLLTGLEPQWRNIWLVIDPAAWNLLLLGLAPTVATAATLVLIATASRNVWFLLTGTGLQVIHSFVSYLSKGIHNSLPFARQRSFLTRIRSNQEGELEQGNVKRDARDGLVSLPYDTDDLPAPKRRSLLHLCCGSSLAWQLLSTALRPSGIYGTNMSWTALLVPLIGISSAPTLSSTSSYLGHLTAVRSSTATDWSAANVTADFGNRYDKSQHYVAYMDPLKLTNIDAELLPALQDRKLESSNIRHIVLLTLESTRSDVFPLKEDGIIWQRLATTFEDGEIPEAAQARLASLTPFASWFVGEHDHLPASERWSERGSLVAQDATTTSTYTLKSMTGTHCGLSPLAADFNVEYAHPMYQLCLPQIFDMFNTLHCSESEPKDAQAALHGNWTSIFMQATTLGFDHQDALMPIMGFPEDKIIGSSYLHEQHKFGPAAFPDVNYYGMPEEAVESYLRDAFADAKKSNERVFLSHLTSTTHHEFDIPDPEKYIPLSGSWEWESLSRYLNAVSYVDCWLAKIMDILESESVANETLLVVVGDHGLSIAEQGSYTPYQNPHVASTRVPLIMSLPGLPNVKISDPVSSLQVLPTILDLLIETGSLPECASSTARDLVRDYEGQSLLRPLQSENATSGSGGWQFTITNPGGSVVAVRDARHPRWRLVVPLLSGQEWWFSDSTSDPYEMTPIKNLDLSELVPKIEAKFGREGATWAEEAAKVAGWWVRENHARWQYDTT